MFVPLASHGACCLSSCGGLSTLPQPPTGCQDGGSWNLEIQEVWLAQLVSSWEQKRWYSSSWRDKGAPFMEQLQIYVDFLKKESWLMVGVRKSLYFRWFKTTVGLVK